MLILFGNNLSVIITHSRLINNVVYSGFCDAIIRVIDSNLTVSQSTFNNNTGRILRASSTEVSISHSEFLCNNDDYYFGGVLTTIDYGKFINNPSPESLLCILLIANGTEVGISYNYEYDNESILSLEGVAIHHYC